MNRGHQGIVIHTALYVGSYLITPMTRSLGGGRYASSVSIRSGRGTMTQDRVMRFTPEFDSDAQAARFAAEQALEWVEQRQFGAGL